MSFHQVLTVNTLKVINEASTAKLTVLFKKYKLKQCLASQHIWFNRECLRLKIVPKYVNLKTKSRSPAAIKALKLAQLTWIKLEMKKWYNVRDSVSVYLFHIHSLLTSKLHPLEFDYLDRNIRYDVNFLVHKTFLNQKQKLTRLVYVENSKSVETTVVDVDKISFAKRVVNTSSIDFDSNEMNLLNKGLKYCPNIKLTTKNLENLAIDVDIAIRSDMAAKYLCSTVLKKETCSNLNNNLVEMRALKSIQSKSRINNLVISKADKGNTTVIMDRSDYVTKMNDVLSGPSFIILKRDPTASSSEVVKTVIDKANACFPTERMKKMYKLMNPQCPRLYGLPKIHKINTPLRPVVSFNSAPSYKLAKNANQLFKHKLNFSPKFSIKNSIELVNKIKDITVPLNSKLVSFDVVSLFTSVPIPELKLAFLDFIDSKNLNPLLVNDIKSIVNCCIDQNFFKFNDKIYQQLNGLAMGSPLSPILADFFMDFLESKISNFDLFKNVIYWYRYVDDILVLWGGTERQLNQFLKHINNVNPHIQFTMELGLNKINFLDLTIEIINNRHCFSIFRKDSYSDNIINNSSRHHISHKLATFHCFIHRLLLIPMTKASYELELNTIKQIAMNNGYDSDLIDRLLFKKHKKLALLNVSSSLVIKESTVEKQWVKLSYLGRVSEKIARKFNKNLFNVTFYNSFNLQRILVNSKDRLNILNQSGIYLIDCDSCGARYIGQTGRAFNIRFKEHLACSRKGNELSSFGNHLFLNKHKFDISKNFKILHVNNKSLKLDKQEILEINRHKFLPNSNLLNEQVIFASSPLLYPFH